MSWWFASACVSCGFDGSLPEIGALAALDDAALVDVGGGWARAENAACALKLAVMAEMFARRTGLPAGDRELWWVDPLAAVAAEMAAAVNISQGMALHQTHRGVALRDRLPTVARLFEKGLISDWLVRTIVWRTYLITDEAAMAAVDRALAAQVTRWGALSIAKTETAIDALVDEFDPAALRRSRQTAAKHDVEFRSPSDVAGTTSMWARLYSPDAALIEQRVEQMARSVCDNDPRTIAERRADALTALAAGTELACACEESGYAAGQRDEAPNKTAVVYVVADETTVDAATAAAAQPEPQPCSAPPTFVMGAGVMPAPLLAATLDRATLREVHHPGEAPPVPRYVPSRKLAELRALPRPDVSLSRLRSSPPANCDIDHTVPYPVGPTHPSNLKCLCRFHHLLKTFWNGLDDGWRDRQQPDGSVIWTAPTGHTYTTYPGSMHLFPKLCKPTSTLWPESHMPRSNPSTAG